MIAILIILTILIILDAVGDGLRANGKQLAHHIMEAVQVALWMLFAYMTRIELYYFIWMLIFYTSLRALIFDMIFNITAGNKLFYFGNSSLWDRFMRRNASIVYWISLVVMIGSIWRLFN